MTRLEQIHAHQGLLEYLHTNDLTCSTHALIETLNPETPWGVMLLRTIARRVGRSITDADVPDIIAYTTT